MTKRIVLLFIVLGIVISLPGRSQSNRDHELNFYSAALGKETNCRVLLPQVYDADEIDKKYPVVFLLHGASSGYESFDLLLPIIEGFWANGFIQPFILVMPDGTSEPFLGSFYTNSSLYGNYEDMIYQDLIPFIDSSFNTNNKSSFRGIWGFSMGAYGSFKQIFKHPELYSVVAAHSGPVNFELLDNLIPDLKEEQGNQAPYNWQFESGKSLTNLMLSMAGAFSPDPEAENLVDFPVDSEGEIRSEILERWEEHNISQMAVSLPSGFNAPIYFDCGTIDEYKLIHHNRALSDTLTKYGVEHRFEEYLGDHTTGLIFRIPVALRFLDEAFDKATGIDETPYYSSANQILTYPNPAQNYFMVNWEAEISESATLIITDYLGKLIDQKPIHAGESKIVDSSTYPAGLYFISIKNDQVFINSKLIIN